MVIIGVTAVTEGYVAIAFDTAKKQNLATGAPRDNPSDALMDAAEMLSDFYTMMAGDAPDTSNGKGVDDERLKTPESAE